jgi:hypothetical protein
MPLEKNDLGGINDHDGEALERAKAVDLITLPQDIKGTNCYNCKWISSDKKSYGAMCKQPKVKQYVNQRMCCILWSSKGEYRPFKRDKGFD